MAKEVSFDPFDQCINHKEYLQACRSLFFGIKALEQKSNNIKLPVILTRAIQYLSNLMNTKQTQYLSSVIPVVLEQTFIY